MPRFLVVCAFLVVGCQRPNETKDVVDKTSEALTHTQVSAAKQAGFLPVGGTTIELLDPIVPAGITATISIANDVNSSGAIVGGSYSPDITYPNWTGPIPISNPFLKDSTGQHYVQGPWADGSTTFSGISDDGTVVGYGGPAANESDALQMNIPFVRHPGGTYEFLPGPSFGTSFAQVVSESTGKPLAVGHYGWPYTAGMPGTMDHWPFTVDGSDTADLSPVPMPTQASDFHQDPGEPSPYLRMNGDRCLQVPETSEQWVGGSPEQPGVTMIAWIRLRPETCSSPSRVVLMDDLEAMMAVGCNADATAGVTSYFYDPAGVATTPLAGHIPFETWTQIAVTWDHHTIRTYVNGDLAGSVAHDGALHPAGPQTLSVGCLYSPDYHDYYFLGDLHDVALIRNPLSHDQIVQFKNGHPSYHFGTNDNWARYRISDDDGRPELSLLPMPYDAGSSYWMGAAWGAAPDGTVVGYTFDLGTGNWTPTGMLYSPVDGMHNLNKLLPPDQSNAWYLGYTNGVNSSHVVVGVGTHNGVGAAFKFDVDNGVISEIPQIEGSWYSSNPAVTSINAAGHIAGFSTVDGAGTPGHAFVYTEGWGSTDLNDLLDPTIAQQGWVLRRAYIYDGDVILGQAENALTGVTKAYKMTLSWLAAAQCNGAPEGGVCNDNNPCTLDDVCHDGICAGALKDCPAQDHCHVAGTCDPQSGQCSNLGGGEPVTCGTPGVCQKGGGACNPTTGCAPIVAADEGTACDDGNACTQLDTCKSGVCTGGNPVVCPAGDACHSGSVCDTHTGTCSQLLPVQSVACTGGTFDYDQAGRLVRDHATTLVYDAYDQLRVVIPGPSDGSSLELKNLPVEELALPDQQSGGNANGTNAAGQATGSATAPDGTIHALYWSGPGAAVDLNVLGNIAVPAFGSVPGRAYGARINPSGTILGERLLADGSFEPMLITPPSATNPTATVNYPGKTGTGDTYPAAVNSSGQFVGYHGQYLGPRQAYVYTDGTGYLDIPGFGGPWSEAWGIDDSGNVYGNSALPETPLQNLADPIHYGHALLFHADTQQSEDLNGLVDPVTSPGWVLLSADSGVGEYVFGLGRLDGVDLAFRLNKVTGEVIPIGPLGGTMIIGATNPSGDAVGTGWNQAGFVDRIGWAFIQGHFMDLNSVIDPASGWHITNANDINDDGDVVGQGTLNGVTKAFRLRLPLRTAGGKGPTLAEAHTYGYDGLRTSTTTMNVDGSNVTSQYWFSQDYTETTTGTREHYIRIGNRVVAKVINRLPSMGGLPVSWEESSSRRRGDGGDRVATIFVFFLFAIGCAATLAGFFGKKRRPAWVVATAGPVVLFFLASCEMIGMNRRSAETLWQKVDVLYFHQGLLVGAELTTKPDGTVREERRYDPFGTPVDAMHGTAIGTADFVGDQLDIFGNYVDANTKWSYRGARWLQPQVARWTAPDPMVASPERLRVVDVPTFDAANSTGMASGGQGRSIVYPDLRRYLGGLRPFNEGGLYAYGGNNPVLYGDPTGRMMVLVALIVGAAGLVALGFAVNSMINTIKEWHERINDFKKAGDSTKTTAITIEKQYDSLEKNIEGKARDEETEKAIQDANQSLQDHVKNLQKVGKDAAEIIYEEVPDKLLENPVLEGATDEAKEAIKHRAIDWLERKVQPQK